MSEPTAGGNAGERRSSARSNRDLWAALPGMPHPIRSPKVGARVLAWFCERDSMRTQFTYWKEVDGRHLGYLNDCPDQWTKGEDVDDLKEHLRNLFQTFSAEQIPGVRKVEELEIA